MYCQIIHEKSWALAENSNLVSLILHCLLWSVQFRLFSHQSSPFCPPCTWSAPIGGGLNHSALVIATLCAIWPMSHCIISYLNRSNLESMELCSNFELLDFSPPDLYKPILCQAEIMHAWFVLLWICVVCSLRIFYQKLYPAHLLMYPCLSVPRKTQTALQQLSGERWQPRLMVLHWANCRRMHGRNKREENRSGKLQIVRRLA